MKPHLDARNNCYIDAHGTRYPFRTAAEKRLAWLLASAGCRPLRKGLTVQSKIVVRDENGKFLAELPWDATVPFTRAASQIINKKETDEPTD